MHLISTFPANLTISDLTLMALARTLSVWYRGKAEVMKAAKLDNVANVILITTCLLVGGRTATSLYGIVRPVLSPES